MKATIARMLAMRPQVMYLTHYGPLTGVESLAADLCRRVDQMVALAESRADVPDRHAALCAALREGYVAAAQHHGVSLGADRKSTRLNSSHYCATRMPSSA